MLLNVLVLMDLANPGPTGLAFLFYLLFLWSRKFSNATSSPPEDNSKANIPKNIIIIS